MSPVHAPSGRNSTLGLAPAPAVPMAGVGWSGGRQLLLDGNAPVRKKTEGTEP